MKVAIAATAAAFMLIAGSAQARAGAITGTVIAKHPRTGTFVLAGPRGLGMTIRLYSANLRLGDRVQLTATPLTNGTMRAVRVRLVAHVRSAMIRGMVVRTLRNTMFVATGHSILAIHHAATRRLASTSDDGEQQPGTIGDFRVRFADDELVENDFVPATTAGTVQIEGRLVSVSPLVVSVEGLPLTITVPSGVTLPAGLAIGQQVELAVQAGVANSFTLVAVNEPANAGALAAGEEVEATGAVVSSTAAQLVINAGGAMLTFTAPAGTALPIIATGTLVEVRGVSANGSLTLQRVELAGQSGEDNGGSGNDGGGNHDGGGGSHDGGGGDGGSGGGGD